MWPESPSFPFQKSREPDHPLKKSIFAEGLEPEEVCPPPPPVRIPFIFCALSHIPGRFTWTWTGEWHVRPGVNQEILSSWPGCPSITVDLRSCHTHTIARRQRRCDVRRDGPLFPFSPRLSARDDNSLLYTSDISHNTPQNQSRPCPRGFHGLGRPTCVRSL